MARGVGGGGGRGSVSCRAPDNDQIPITGDMAIPSIRPVQHLYPDDPACTGRPGRSPSEFDADLADGIRA